MRFSKYHGCGNDFILGMYEKNVDYNHLAREICNRHTGIGADGLIILKRDYGFEMMFYNADGTRGTMCGNGIRCLSKYICDQGLVDKIDKLEIKTLSGLRTVYIDDDKFIVNMGRPLFDAKAIGVNIDGELFDYKLKYKDTYVTLDGCFMTTDHIVVLCNELNHDTNLGKFLCENKFFAKGVNVNFVKINNKNEISIETYERGVGWTLACGSGSCASFAVLNHKKLINDNVTVHLKIDDLNIYKEIDDIIMKGTATLVSNNIEYKI